MKVLSKHCDGEGWPSLARSGDSRRGQRLGSEMIMSMVSRLLEGGRVNTRGRCADCMKSWNSSSGSSDTAGRARWARARRAQPCCSARLSGSAFPELVPPQRTHLGESKLPQVQGTLLCLSKYPFPHSPPLRYPPLPASFEPGAKALVRLYIPEPTPGGKEGPPGAGAADL